MSHPTGLDLSVLNQFRPSDLLTADLSPTAPGVPMQVDIEVIDFDLSQPRRQIDEEALSELAASVAMHGILEPVSLRTHPEAAGRFVVNRGERRVRAAQKAGQRSVPAFIDERIDPYAQAVENLHRESMSPFDLAAFIATREKDGEARAEIARRLNKSRSFITEAASLIDAPEEVKTAFEAGRLGSDGRLLYRLVTAMRRVPAEARALLAGESAITRSGVEQLLEVAASSSEPAVREQASRSPQRALGTPSAGRTVLIVERAGRRGTLRFKAHDNDFAEVRFGDGSCEMVKLCALQPVCWATEE